MLNYRKHNLWRAFVDFLFDNDGKVASSYKHTHIKARVQKPHPIYDQNGQNQLRSIPYLWPKRLKNHTLWGCTYLYTCSPYKGVPPPPAGCVTTYTNSMNKYKENCAPEFQQEQASVRQHSIVFVCCRVTWNYNRSQWVLCAILCTLQCPR